MKSSDNVLYVDNHLVLANKPAGLLTQPDESHAPDLEGQLKAWVKEEYQKPGAVFLHAVHRLDKPVSGLVLFARTSKALSRLNEQVREGKIRRFYLAEVEGIVDKSQGRLEHFLRHGSHSAILSRKEDPEAKLAILSYSVEERGEATTRLLIELYTGRYHQIRAQCAAIGHPIVGDHRYGAKSKGTTIHLHCRKLLFAHPVTKEELEFVAAPPF